jgi:hypothetical protein
MSMSGRIYHFTYAVPPHNKKTEADGATLRWARDLHLIRDASAFVELAKTIFDAGYSWGETVLNLYFEEQGKTPQPSHAPDLCDDDLIVMTTRCPLDDDEDEDAKKRIRRSYTPLETAVFHTARCFLKRSKREKIILAKPLQDFRKDVGLPRGSFRFPKTSAEEKPTSRREKEAEQTREMRKQILGFLVFAPRLIKAEPTKRGETKRQEEPTCKGKFLLSFGMAGVENLLWARTLRRKHSDLLSKIVTSDQYWCVVGRWDPKQSVAPRFPQTLTYSNGIELDLEIAVSEAPFDRNAWQLVG